MRVVVIAGGDPGHVFPASGLAQALNRRGHQAWACVGGQWLEALARDGIPAVQMPHPPPNPEPDAVRRLRQTSRRLAPAIAEVLSPLEPDLIVGDVMTPSAGFAAGLLGVPWIELVPHPIQDPSPFLPPAGSGLRTATGPIRRARDRRLYRITSQQWAQGRAARETDRERLGMPRGGHPIGRLFAALPALEAPRPDWPSDAHLVGPIEWDPAATDLALPPGDGPLVMVSATTVTGVVSGLAATAIEGLEGTGYRMAWTVLGAPGSGLPSWVSAGPGRQGPLIEAASAVICGGGHGILAKALVRGKPVVTVPGGGEQWENATRVRRSGLGIRLMPQLITPSRLRRAVRRVVEDPAFAAAAARCVPPDDAPSSGDRAVDVIERLMASAHARTPPAVTVLSRAAHPLRRSTDPADVAARPTEETPSASPGPDTSPPGAGGDPVPERG